MYSRQLHYYSLKIRGMGFISSTKTESNPMFSFFICFVLLMRQWSSQMSQSKSNRSPDRPSAPQLQDRTSSIYYFLSDWLYDSYRNSDFSIPETSKQNRQVDGYWKWDHRMLTPQTITTKQHRTKKRIWNRSVVWHPICGWPFLHLEIILHRQ